VIEDSIEEQPNIVSGGMTPVFVTKRITKVDEVNVTHLCGMQHTDAQRLEAAKRYIDRTYPEPDEQGSDASSKDSNP